YSGEPMELKLSLVSPSQIEAECLAVTVLDGAASKEKDPKPVLQTEDAAIRHAAAEVLASGEATGRIFETVMLHRPQGLKAKRLLLVGGGKQKNFTNHELRRVAGTAVRFLKPKNIRSFGFLAAGSDLETVKAIAEGATVGDFDPDSYKSDRK